MSKIKIMDEILANKIAAGEVVEKCVSVVKELVENSIDAKSTEIKIELIEAGTKEIKVTDNGIGMDKEDAVMAFNRHATSKLSNEYDLFHINTLGFRGEALASIASVSDILLSTSTGNVGSIVSIKGGKLESVTNGDARKGTIIKVSNLFYNTPARLKHMKSLYTELASITDYVNKIALSYPNIKFTLTNNSNIILNTTGNNNQLKVIRDIFGIEVTKKMLEVNASNDDYDVTGYISLPELHRSSRNHMITLVNGRVVRNSELNKAITDSYHDYQPENRYPIVVLNINVDSSLIDVNIHPTKMDIKFSKMEELKELIIKIIKNNLSKKTLIPNVVIAPIDREIYKEITMSFDEINEPITNYRDKESTIELEDNIKPIISDTTDTRLPIMYPVGLVHGTYIISQNDDGMFLIDQHAAKERINYEIYKKKLTNPSNDTISLLFPITMELTNSEYIKVKENFDFIKQMNIEIEDFGINSVIIKSHPTWLPVGYEEEAIRKIIELIINLEKNFNLSTFYDHLASSLACKMSIKANTNITIDEMDSLINDLRKCNNPFNCPHGRPTVISYTKYDLEKLFKRSGF